MHKSSSGTGHFADGNTLIAAVVALTMLMATPAAAEMYRWVDVDGGVHFTDDPSQVPASQTRDALVEMAALDSRVSPRASAASDRHVISVGTNARELRIRARLNGSAERPFVIDTGAMINMIPHSWIEPLGLTIDAATPTTLIRGISGHTQRVPVITLRSLEVSGAVVENLEMAVVESLPDALLGMPFFNHFRVEFDPANGTVTLHEITPRRASANLQLEWNTVPGAARYHVEVSADPEFSRLLDEVWATEPSASLDSLKGTLRGTYFWRVAAVDTEGDKGPWSSTSSLEL